MEHLVETSPNKLWPYGSDKRMLFSIYAHFNTMIKREDSLDIAAPISQKLHKICTNLKSLIQIITGMTKIEKLDFELPDLLANNHNNHNNDNTDNNHNNNNTDNNQIPDPVPLTTSTSTSTSIPPKKSKKKRKKKRRSQTHGNKIDHLIGSIRDSINQNKTTMLTRKHSSQTAIIYELDDHPEIINDYRESKSNTYIHNNSNNNNNHNNHHQYSASFDGVAGEKYRQALVQRNNLTKKVHKPCVKPDDIDPLLFVEPLENKRQEYKDKTRQPPPPAQARKKSVPPAMRTMKTPSVGFNKPRKDAYGLKKRANTVGKRLNTVRQHQKKIVEPTKQMCLNICLEEFKVSKDGNDCGFIVFVEKYLGLTYLKNIFKKYGINEIESVNQLTNVLSISIILYKAKVFKINKNVNASTFDKSKIQTIAKYLAKWVIDKYGDDIDGLNDDDDCIDITPKDFKEKMYLYLKEFVDESKNDNGIKVEKDVYVHVCNAEPCEQEYEKEEKIHNAENVDVNSNVNESNGYGMYERNGNIEEYDNMLGKTPPLPRKSDKTVTLQTVHKTWKQRRQRPLPQPKYEQ